MSTGGSSSQLVSHEREKEEHEGGSNDLEEESEENVTESNVLDKLKQELEQAEKPCDCFWDYFRCMVFRDAHASFFDRTDVKKLPLHVRQKAVKDYYNGEAKQRLLCAIGFLLAALFCLGAMNFMENLDDMFPVTYCKVNLDVTKYGGFQVSKQSFKIARLKNCPPSEKDHKVNLGQNEGLQVKYVECHAWKTPIETDSDCFNVFICDETTHACSGPLFT